MAGDAPRDPMRDLVLRQAIPGFDTVRIDEMYGIGVAAERSAARADVVGDDPVAAFAATLGFGVRDNVLGFGGEADDQPRPRFSLGGEGRENIGIFRQLERWRPAA